MLPPGQRARKDFPRFGLPQYASRFPSKIDDHSIEVEIDGKRNPDIDLSSSALPRCTVKTDFHCVTTWSYLGVEWSGIRFMDLFKLLERNSDIDGVTGAILHAQDGYKTSLLLEDLLRENVLVADSLNGKPLSIEHGAPLRLIAPDHYGYKNLKHLYGVKFYTDIPVVKRGIRAFLDHPRARVKKEERGRWIPGWILRYMYRPLIVGTVNSFKRAMRQYRDGKL